MEEAAIHLSSFHSIPSNKEKWIFFLLIPLNFIEDWDEMRWNDKKYYNSTLFRRFLYS